MLKQVHPDASITAPGLQVLDDFLLSTLAKLCDQISGGLSAKDRPWEVTDEMSFDWDKDVHILGEVDGKLLLGTDNESFEHAHVKWYARQILPAEMHDKVAAWDAKSDGGKLAALHNSILHFQRMGQEGGSSFADDFTTAVDAAGDSSSTGALVLRWMDPMTLHVAPLTCSTGMS